MRSYDKIVTDANMGNRSIIEEQLQAEDDGYTSMITLNNL